MNYRFQYLPYRRVFRRSLVTAYGEWSHREGIVVRLEREDGAFGFGEIAPLPWFGTETFEVALSFCSEIANVYIPDPRDLVVEKLPCFNWAIGSALESVQSYPEQHTFSVAALVAGADSFVEKQALGFQTFKLKIGTRDLQTELANVDMTIDQMEPGQRLRLDANGGLSELDFKDWLEFLEGKPIDYLEQPLGVGLENRMLEVAEPFSTPLALDESIAGADSLRRWCNWPGPLVVKPSLLGWV